MPQDLPQLLGAISIAAITLISLFAAEWTYKQIKILIQGNKSNDV